MSGAWIQDIYCWDCCIIFTLSVLLIFGGYQVFSNLQGEKEFTATESTSPFVILEEGYQEFQDEWPDNEEMVDFHEKNVHSLETAEKRLEELNGFLERSKIKFEQQLGDLFEPQYQRDLPEPLFQLPPEGHVCIPALRLRVEQVCGRTDTIKRNLMEIRYSSTENDIISDLERRVMKIEQEVEKQNEKLQ